MVNFEEDLPGVDTRGLFPVRPTRSSSSSTSSDVGGFLVNAGTAFLQFQEQQQQKERQQELKGLAAGTLNNIRSIAQEVATGNLDTLAGYAKTLQAKKDLALMDPSASIELDSFINQSIGFNPVKAAFGAVDQIEDEERKANRAFEAKAASMGLWRVDPETGQFDRKSFFESVSRRQNAASALAAKRKDAMQKVFLVGKSYETNLLSAAKGTPDSIAKELSAMPENLRGHASTIIAGMRQIQDGKRLDPRQQQATKQAMDMFKLEVQRQSQMDLARAGVSVDPNTFAKAQENLIAGFGTMDKMLELGSNAEYTNSLSQIVNKLTSANFDLALANNAGLDYNIRLLGKVPAGVANTLVGNAKLQQAILNDAEDGKEGFINVLGKIYQDKKQQVDMSTDEREDLLKTYPTLKPTAERVTEGKATKDEKSGLVQHMTGVLNAASKDPKHLNEIAPDLSSSMVGFVKAIQSGEADERTLREFQVHSLTAQDTLLASVEDELRGLPDGIVGFEGNKLFVDKSKADIRAVGKTRTHRNQGQITAAEDIVRKIELSNTLSEFSGIRPAEDVINDLAGKDLIAKRTFKPKKPAAGIAGGLDRFENTINAVDTSLSDQRNSVLQEIRKIQGDVTINESGEIEE